MTAHQKVAQKNLGVGTARTLEHDLLLAPQDTRIALGSEGGQESDDSEQSYDLKNLALTVC